MGLLIDVMGAAVIAVPDIPHLRKYHTAGQLRFRIALLDVGGLPRGGKGFRELISYLEEFTEDSIPDDIHAVSVEPSGVGERTVMVNLDDEGDKYELTNFPYRVVRLALMEKIREREAYIRGIGFLLLSLGFGFQIAGLLV